jgi:dTDP-4-dehydrorhamnose reductase
MRQRWIVTSRRDQTRPRSVVRRGKIVAKKGREWKPIAHFMKITLLGGTGYVGGAFARFLATQKVELHFVQRAKDGDYTRAEILQEIIQKSRPDFLINCAGYTGKPNVDACEQHKAETLQGNAVFPGVLREVCESAGVLWGHVSSGCIYSGFKPDGTGFTEEDPPNFSFRSPPCSFYSGSKALGEEVLEGARACYIWRLRIPFDHRANPRNFLTKLMRYERLLEARNSLSHLEDFVKAAWACWTQQVPFGTYNVTNPGSVTTSEVVDLIRESGVCPKDFLFFANEEEFMALAAVAPRSNCVLDTSKLQQAGIVMRDVRTALADSLQNWKVSS